MRKLILFLLPFVFYSCTDDEILNANFTVSPKSPLYDEYVIVTSSCDKAVYYSWNVDVSLSEFSPGQQNPTITNSTKSLKFKCSYKGKYKIKLQVWNSNKDQSESMIKEFTVQ